MSYLLVQAALRAFFDKNLQGPRCRLASVDAANHDPPGVGLEM